jgi:dynein heavy chain
VLEEPCTSLAEAEPRDIPGQLPGILSRVRVISNASTYYGKERLTALLRKVSNEIIRRCQAKISLEDVFDGDVLSAVRSLNESIECGKQWNAIYHEVAAAVKRSARTPAGREWDFDEAAIFAQVDAFMQRCRDLLDVCDGQMQFSRKTLEGGKQCALPAFGGSKGPEIAKSLSGIEETFGKHLDALRPLMGEILDVKATRWHDACNGFKAGVRDLEVMMQNVISVAFDGVTTVKVGVALLEAFSSLARLPSIVRSVDKKTSEVYMLFLQQLTETKRYFDVHRLVRVHS